MYQVNVIDGGAEAFAALTYQEQHPNTLAFLRSQFDNISGSLNEMGQSFYQGMRNAIEQAYSSDALRRARLAVQKVRNIFERDDVRLLSELIDIQAAQSQMQRWVMANPVLRELYHKQQCDGYSNSFVDMFPGQIGEDHYDYRRVMQGMVQDDEENDWKATFYLDEIYDGDRELTFEEQIDVLDTWDCVNAFIKRGEDPSSQFGNKL